MTEQDLIDLYHERAGVMEFDGKLERHLAELAAYTDWRKVVGPGVATPEKIVEIVTAARKRNAEG